MIAQAQWLPLLNYSSKHGVSLSTLRRRIKSNTIQFKLEGGKYFILDEKTPTKVQPKILSSDVHINAIPSAPPTASPAASIAQQTTPLAAPQAMMGGMELPTSSFVEASILTSANRLVEEIKAAYAKILQEKEEQIAQLKEEVVDLRMLARILEETSSRKTAQQAPSKNEEALPAEDFLFGDYQNRNI